MSESSQNNLLSRVLARIFLLSNLFFLAFCLTSYFAGRTIFGLDGLALFNLWTVGYARLLAAFMLPEWLAVIIGTAVSSLITFWLGYLLGWIYLKSKNKGLRWLFFVGLFSMLLLVGLFVKQKTVSLATVVSEAADSQACVDNAGSSAYSLDQCFTRLAIKLGDVRICDDILKYGDNKTTHNVGVCYIDFMRKRSSFNEKITICDLIEDDENQFGCYRELRQCDKMASSDLMSTHQLDSGREKNYTDTINRCWIGWAEEKSNNKYCRYIKDEDRLTECECIAELGPQEQLTPIQKKSCETQYR